MASCCPDPESAKLEHCSLLNTTRDRSGRPEEMLHRVTELGRLGWVWMVKKCCPQREKTPPWNRSPELTGRTESTTLSEEEGRGASWAISSRRREGSKDLKRKITISDL